MNTKLEIKQESIEEIVDRCNLKHIAVIMDGNRRWAKEHNLPSASGHTAGVKSLKNIVKYAGEIGIKYLTVYAFSTENWGRKKEEVQFLMFLFNETFKKEMKELEENNVKIKIIGDLSKLPAELQQTLNTTMENTRQNTGLHLQIAINYGARDELTNAIKNIAADVKAGKITTDEINPDIISQYLYTNDIPDPDLLIRTSGEYRISNYLLWQIAYSELYVTDTLWPDFGKSELDNAIMDFASRNRRFGKG